MKSINLQRGQIVLIALSISLNMRYLGRVKNFSTYLLAFAGVAATLMMTACGNGPTEPNQAPEAYGLIEELGIDVGQSESLNLGAEFNDPDGDALTYTAESSNTDVATVSVSGSTAILAGVAAGSATITVIATDPGRLSASVSISVTVARFRGACAVGMELNPGHACSVGSDRFTVLANGSGRFGCCLTSGRGIHINQFSASRITGTDRWRINSVP